MYCFGRIFFWMEGGSFASVEKEKEKREGGKKKGKGKQKEMK